MYVYGELQVAQLENLASDPALTPKGRVYIHTSQNVLKYYNGSAWKDVCDTSTVQTLTNKTLTNPTITDPQISGTTTDIVFGTGTSTHRLVVPSVATNTAMGLISPNTKGSMLWKKRNY